MGGTINQVSPGKCLLLPIPTPSAEKTFSMSTMITSEVEEIDMIRERLLSCLNHIDKERLIAAPDCGLGYLSRDMAMLKLKNLSKAAKSI